MLHRDHPELKGGGRSILTPPVSHSITSIQSRIAGITGPIQQLREKQKYSVKFLLNFPFFFQTVAELGVVIFTALDYGLKDEEERQLSPALENVIDLMTSAGEQSDSQTASQASGQVCCGLYFDQNTSSELCHCHSIILLPSQR